jgi:hypothetical protein
LVTPVQFRIKLRPELLDEGQADIIATLSNQLGLRKAIEADRELLEQIISYRRLLRLTKLFLKGPKLEATTNVRPATIMVNNFLRREIRALEEMLIAKNTQYDNAALEPIHIFSNLDSLQTIKVRLDDKLKRLSGWFQNPENAVTVETIYQNEDTINDLIGYLFLLRAGARFRSGFGDDDDGSGLTSVQSEVESLAAERDRLTHLALTVNKNTTFNIERDKQIAKDRAALDADIEAFEKRKARNRKLALKKRKANQPRARRSYTRKKSSRKKVR